jgi:hypothetical protein
MVFEPTWEKWEAILRSQFVTLERGDRREHRPYVFTEQGVAVLSSALR